MAKVVLAMSGGVDSSVAAHLLLQDGHDVVGVFMRHGEASAEVCRVDHAKPGMKLPVVTATDATSSRADHKQGCCSASDAVDARRVAAKLGIPFYALDLQSDFRRIVDYFVDDYIAGRTPNPCVKCNHWIKFGRLFDFAEGVDAQFVATGHYARMVRDDCDQPQLHRGLDGNKDQSYALFGIARQRLERMLLPVGDYEKPKIRQLATSLGLSVAGKRDSQEICFVTQGHHSDFVKARRGDSADSTAGQFVTVEGRVVGEHQGYEAFTIGQRRGLGIALGEPHFVVRIDPQSRQVVLGLKESLLRSGLIASDVNWLCDPPAESFRCAVQIRYNSDAEDALVKLEADDRFSVEFDHPQAGVAPGQAAVIYDGTQVIGGGWIESSF
jgi:tRNA-uridine 2-sulfurtransferase